MGKLKGRAKGQRVRREHIFEENGMHVSLFSLPIIASVLSLSGTLFVSAGPSTISERPIGRLGAIFPCRDSVILF